MKTLILKNYSTERAWGRLMIDAIADHVKDHQPSAEIDVCGAADGQPLPDLKQYDLLILTGGVFDLVNYCPNPWVDPLLDQTRAFVNSKSDKNLLVICWGHQATQFAMGGKLEMTPEGPIVGVEDIPLTSAGRDIFHQESLALHKFHKRRVAQPAPGFQALAVNNEIFISDSGNILTFQSHPEMTLETAQDLLDADDGTYRSKRTDPTASLRGVDSVHDGALVWKYIMQWVDA